MKDSWGSILWFKDRIVASVTVGAWNGIGTVTNDMAIYNRDLLGVAT